MLDLSEEEHALLTRLAWREWKENGRVITDECTPDELMELIKKEAEREGIDLKTKG